MKTLEANGPNSPNRTTCLDCGQHINSFEIRCRKCKRARAATSVGAIDGLIKSLRTQLKTAEDEIRVLKGGLIAIRQCTEIMEARRYAEQALKEPAK